ncbi:MAG: LacI family DNA-binding transcriptional regulator [Hungatella sp.]|nr:LacI family DNA-binding transcriptional regulator [Hungatella sp.]
MKRKKNVTMQDIADYLSISKVTVSKALNGKDGVGRELKEKIIAVSKELNYKLPESSKTCSGNSKNIAIFMKEKFAYGEAGFYLKFYQRISVELNERGYLAHLFPINSKEDRKGKLLPLLEKHDIAGVIFLGDIEKIFLSEVKQTQLPCVLADTYDNDFDMDCVITESMYSMCELTTYLMKCGHKSIGFVGTITATNSIMDRYLGYCRAHLKAGLPIRDEWIIGDRNMEGENVEFMLPEHMPTAFVCNCDDTAYRFVRMLTEKGYRVPEDISIVSFDNDIYAELCVPKLTTAEVDINQMACKSVELICEKTDQDNVRRRGVTFVNTAIIYRDSVRNMES